MTPVQAEAALASLLMPHARGERWEHRHPVVALQALALLRRLPLLEYQPSGSRESRAIHGRIERSSLGVITPLHDAMSVLELPRPPARYDEGHNRATQRRHARKALKAGVTWTCVTDPTEREGLVQVYRSSRARIGDAGAREADLAFLDDCGLWLVAWNDGHPIHFSATAVDGAWAMLFSFSSLASGQVASATRYLMTGVLADRLAARGVRYLCDSKSAIRLTAGVREFSRMVGFRTARVRVSSVRTAAEAA